MIDTSLATAPENNVVVHAAAGTGKTWLLTSRIVRLMLEGNKPGSILAITFTRKAAGEIYQRVSERLLALASVDHAALTAQLKELGVQPTAALHEKARGLYEDHLGALHTLRATTFHAFCHEILKRFPLEAEVPPGFELLESSTELETSAWLALDRQVTRENNSTIAAAMDILLKECGGVGNARQALGAFLTHRSDWWAYTENQADPAAFAEATLRRVLDIARNPEPLNTLVLDQAIRARIARYIQLLAKHATDTNQKHVENLSQALAAATSLDVFYSKLSVVFLTSAGEQRILKPSKVLEKIIGSAEQNELLILHQEIATQIYETKEWQKRVWTFRVSNAWFRSGQTLLGHYQRIKSEHNALDFSDLEWKTYRLLTRSHQAEWVQYKLDQRIDHLLVDEFQDTNPTQWQLLLPLLEEMAAGDPDRRRSIFLVGDEKQSIYRFRRAEARLFHSARDWLMLRARASVFNQHVSWRSSPAIIGFVNLLFQVHEDAGTTLETATPDDFHLRDFQPHETHRTQMWGHAELLPLVRRKPMPEPARDSEPRNPLVQPRIIEEDERRREEGALIVATIQGLMGKPVTHGDTSRPLGYGDIMILLRERTHAESYAAALRHAGIPYAGTGRGGFMRALEVRDLIHLLKVLIEPYNDLALASILRSPIFAADNDHLVHLAHSDSTNSWYERLLRMDCADEQGAPLMRAQQLLPRWNDYAGRLPAHDLIDKIYSEGNIIERYAAASPSHLKSRVEANLNRFLELALEVDSGRYPSLAHFLTQLENLSVDDADTATELTSSATSRVRIMTIHAAKGLEAPVVFLANAARGHEHRDRGVRALIEWPVADSRPRYFHLIGNKEYIDDISRALLREQTTAALREESNLLYVALTRAKQVLYVSGCEPASGSRGWYGFIERRLRHAENSGSAAHHGAAIRHIKNNHDNAVFNTCAKIEFGFHDAIPVNIELELPARPFTLDPRLAVPLSLAETGRFYNPSSSVVFDDDRPQDVIGEHDARTGTKQRGDVIHRMLELLPENSDRDSIKRGLLLKLRTTVLEEAFDNFWREACSVIDHPAFREFFDSARYQEARVETPILYRDGTRNGYGKIDRLVLRQDEIILIDYKTHAHASRQNVRQLAQDYQEQMYQYGTGAALLWPGKKLRLLLLFTACRETVELTAG